MTARILEPRNRSARLALAIAVLATMLAMAAALPAAAGDWTIELQALVMDVYGHDPHVLTVNDLSLDLFTPSLVDSQSVVTVDTNAGGAYRSRFQYDRGRWGWGMEYLWFSTSQDQVAINASGGGPLDPTLFEIAGRVHFSSGPDEVLFFNVLEDTDLAIWTADLYARRTLVEEDDSRLSLVFGLRLGDFDNDYRAVSGVEGDLGTRQDASSNYGAMYGPMVGLRVEARRGKHTLEADLGQSVILGEAELSNRTRDFFGSFDTAPVFFIEESFSHTQDVAIPISELRLGWRYQLTRRLSLGLAAEASAWWDVPVPPGIVPGSGPKLAENTIVFYGLGGGLQMTF